MTSWVSTPRHESAAVYSGLIFANRRKATRGHSGTIKVPAGDDSAHTVTFRCPSPAQPGMLIQFALERQGTKATDTCADVTVVGMELRY
jgi:hypothetical protein